MTSCREKRQTQRDCWPRVRLPGPHRSSLSGWQNALRLPYVWDNILLCNWCISVWLLNLTAEKITVRMFNFAEEKYFWFIYMSALLHVRVRCEKNFWHEFLIRGLNYRSWDLCVSCLKAFIISSQLHLKEERHVEHRRVGALKYTTCTMDRQIKSILRVKHLNQRHRTMFF